MAIELCDHEIKFLGTINLLLKDEPIQIIRSPWYGDLWINTFDFVMKPTEYAETDQVIITKAAHELVKKIGLEVYGVLPRFPSMRCFSFSEQLFKEL